VALIAKIFGWLGGLLLFVFLELLLLISPNSRLFRHLRKAKELSGLQETNKSEPAKITFPKQQPLELGPLPDEEGIPAIYHLPANLPESIHEVQIKARITASADQPIERDYRLYFTSAKPDPQDFYLFLSPFDDEPNLSYNEVNLWIPLTEDKCFYIELSGKVEEKHGSIVKSAISIINYR